MYLPQLQELSYITHVIKLRLGQGALLPLTPTVLHFPSLSVMGQMLD